MRRSKIVFATLTAAALLASVSSADSRGFGHHGRGPVAGLLGGIVVGAATIATLPFVLLADAARGGPQRRSNYGQDDYGYGPPPSYNGQERYGYGPRRGDYGDYGYGPPPPPPPRAYRPYGPPPGYYGY